MKVLKYKIWLGCFLLLGVAVIAAAQFSISTLFSADGYLHIRMAEFIKQYGVKYNFHWARYSIFNGHFADKDFLYHISLIPFTFFPNIFTGAKIAACVHAVFLYLVFFWILRIYSERLLVLISLFVFFCSALFLESLLSGRNMVLVGALLFLFVHFLIREKPRLLFLISFIYALSHVSAPLLLIVAFVCEFSRFCAERRLAARNIAVTAIGVLSGMLVHPNFPNNFLVFYLNGILVPIFALKWGLELGAEFFPLNTRDWVLEFPFVFIGLLLLIISSFSQRRRIKPGTVIWMSAAGLFFVFSFFSQRYLIQGYPIMLAAMAGYFSDWRQSRERFLWFRQHPIIRFFAAAGIALCFVFAGVYTYRNFQRRAGSEFVYNRHYEAVAKWMSDNVPKGEVIFHSNWSDSQYFIGLNPQNDYFVTLDPIYMYYWNPQKYQLYRDIAFGRTSSAYGLLKNEFKVNYGYAGKNYFSGLINQLKNDQRFIVLAEDELGLIFCLR